MCDKNLRLKSPLKVNRPLEFIILTLRFFEEGVGWGEGGRGDTYLKSDF